MNVFHVAAAMLVIGTVSGALKNDKKIREKEYTLPLSTMPGNIEALAQEMMAAAAKDRYLTMEQRRTIETEIYKMLGEGAVLQRNHELTKTREKISYYGLFLSWFMKNKGLSYGQIQAKYNKVFLEDSIELHRAIIQAASRSNDDLYKKFIDTIFKKFGFAPSSKL